MMQAATRALRRYHLFSFHGLQALLVYRAGFALAIVTGAIGLLAQLYLWRAIYASAAGGALAGYTLADMTPDVLVGNLLYLALDNRADHEIAADIMRGDIAINFVRPVSYPVLKFFTSLPVSLTNLVLVGLPLCAAGALLFGLRAPSALDGLLFGASAALSLLVSFLINALVGAVAFGTTNIWGVQIIKTALVGILSGYLIPLSFFGATLQAVGALLPFRQMIAAPLTLFLGKYDGVWGALAIIGQQALWVLLLAGLCALVWQRLARRLEVLGG